MQNLSCWVGVACIAVAVGCSKDDKPVACALSHRIGTYLIHSVERAGGDCGSLPDEVSRIEDVGGLPAGCTKDAPDNTSSDQCRYDRSFSCPGKDGSLASFVGTTTEHDGGKTVSGVLSVTLVDGAGKYVCAAAYDVTSTRQ